MDRVHPPGRITCKHPFTRIHLDDKRVSFFVCRCCLLFIVFVLMGAPLLASFCSVSMTRTRDDLATEPEFFSLHHLSCVGFIFNFALGCVSSRLEPDKLLRRFKNPDAGSTILIKRPSVPPRNPKGSREQTVWRLVETEAVDHF